jgi:subtilisin family serine protease
MATRECNTPRAWHVPRALAAGLVALGIAVAGGSAAAAPGNDSRAAASYDTATAIVQLSLPPLATAPQTHPPRGKKVDFDSNTVKSYRARLAALRNDYKAWLRQNVPGARVTGEFDIALDAVAVELNGATLAQVAAAPMAVRAEYQGVYRPLGSATDPDLSLISAQAAWTQGGGAATAGAGVKVAIVDTGIDVTHPCFSDAGYPAQRQLGDTKFTNNKVIVARVFNNKTPSRGYSAEGLQEHGTHVAGTVACNADTPASVQGVDIPYGISGVAPAALLGNYNVFPGAVESARSEDILDALEAAYADGFDIANMSLGGGANGIQDLLTVAVDNLDAANMVVAVAAGNSGPGLFTVESPGSAARALSAGASSVPHFVGAPVSAGTGTFGAAAGDFAVVKTDLTAPLAAVTGTVNGLANGCSALPATVSGKIVLVSRGTCTFSAKIRNAQAAGAVAVLVQNNVAGDPSAMGTDGAADQPTIPAYMVSRGDGQALQNASGNTATIGAALAYFLTTNADIMAGFSSQGPTDVDFRVKPDVVAPGVNELSSIPLQFCGTPPCFAFFQGTSMATPHLAGSAAVVRGQHRDWSAAEIRSAIVNTAARGVLKNFSTGATETQVNITGAGRENLASAVAAAVSLDPVSVSFGAVPAGSGQTRSFVVTLGNLAAVPQSLKLEVGGGDASVSYAVSPATVSVPARGSVTVTVLMTAQKGASFGGHSGWLDVKAGKASVAHAALFTLVK